VTDCHHAGVVTDLRVARFYAVARVGWAWIEPLGWMLLLRDAWLLGVPTVVAPVSHVSRDMTPALRLVCFVLVVG
jgi:hypothetical protein